MSNKAISLDRLKDYDVKLKDLASLWNKSTSYSLNDIVSFKGTKLKCTTAGTSGTTTLDFTGLVVGDTITDGTVVWEMIEPPSGSGNGLNDWASNTQYKIDDIVVNDGQIYKSLVEFTSGSTFENIEILEDYTLQTGDTPILWAEGTEINTNDIVEYNSNYYKALYDFTCGSTFTKNVFEEYVPKSLTDEQIEEIIEAFNPAFDGATGIEYSTEERRVGTWIDGKSLYQKTIVDTLPTVTTDGTRVVKYIDVSALNIAFGVNIFGVITNTSNGFCPIVNSMRSSNAFYCVYFSKQSQPYDSLWLASSVIGMNNNPIYITIQYTKTTD